jgi:hypothetical protein
LPDKSGGQYELQKVVTLTLNSKMTQVEQQPGFLRSLTRSITSKIADLPPLIQFAPDSDPTLQEVYCEAFRHPLEDTKVFLHWKLHNPRLQTPWPSGLQVIPVLCSPSVRMIFQSEICALEPTTSS